MISDESPVIVDIRSMADYAKGHVEGAVNVPYAAWRGPETNPGALISDKKLTLILSQLGEDGFQGFLDKGCSVVGRDHNR